MSYPIIVYALGGRIIFEADIANGIANNSTDVPESAKCDEDGTLFLPGNPEDYIGGKIHLKKDYLGNQVLEITEGIVDAMRQAERCSFGAVGVDRAGPGFFVNGYAVEHNDLLGVKFVDMVDENGNVRTQIDVLECRRSSIPESYSYFFVEDEDDEEEEEEEDPNDDKEEQMDVDMDEGVVDDEEKRKDSLDVEIQNQIHRMKKMRLREA